MLDFKRDNKSYQHKVVILCVNGHQFDISPSNLRAGEWCPQCPRKAWNRKSDEEYMEEARPIVKAKGGTVLGFERGKQSSYHKIIIRCAEGHAPFRVVPYDLRNGSWCPRCVSSFGEKLLGQVFDQNNIWYNRQIPVIIDEERHLFDFVIRNHDTGQLTYIEWDGEQHYLTPEQGKGNMMYSSDRQRRDNAKDTWCEQHGYDCIRFDYTDTIETVIHVIELQCGYHNLKMPDLSIEPLFRQKKEIADYYKNHSGEQTAERFNINKCTVHDRFKEVYKLTKNEYFKEYGLKNKNRSTDKRVAVIATDHFGNKRLFNSQNEASEYFGVSNKSISAAVRGKCKTVRGFHWRYATPEETLAQQPLSVVNTSA